MSTTTIPLDIRDDIEAMVRRRGDTDASIALGVSRYTLVRALAGLPVRAASADRIRAGLRGDGGRRDG